MALTRKCRWCSKLFEVATQFSDRWHCASCWEWITLPLDGVKSFRKGFTIIGRPKRFRDIERAQEEHAALTVGK